MSTNAALLIIDVQLGIVADPGAHRVPEVLGQISNMLSKARAANVPVIYVQHDGEKGHPLEPGTKGWQIHPEIQPRDGELVIHKQASDSFFETTLHRELEARDIKHLVIAGCMTEYCVDTTSRRAITLGYDVTLVSDAHTTIDNKQLKAAQIIAHHNALLDGFDAGPHAITVKSADAVTL